MSTVPAADDLRYPVGRFSLPPSITPAERERAIDDIAALPARLRAAVAGLGDTQLDTPYRPDGWTVRQVVHHLADSHMNAFTRLKLALTEERPTIKPYDENAFAALDDSRLPVDSSLDLLEALHARWVALWRALDDAQFARSFIHPEHGAPKSIDWLLQVYGWHSRHHVAHIAALRQRQGW